uniref:SER_THR_PHOSPHATASE domain-containing protein n=1 Tax=Caenorhabditis japonica TaxID=281687 RepID=A0A8R1DHC3_CAEJA
MRTYRTDGPRCQVNPDVILKLLERSKEVLKNDAMVVRVTNPAIIFGPIYGEGDSLITLMSQAKLFPPNVTYVMLGGYVGHGFAQLECLFFLLCLKILYPDKVVLLKGHHEESISLEMLKVKEWLFARNISQEAHLEEILLEMKRTCSMMSACALLDENRVLCIPGGPGPVLRERGLAQLEKLKKGFQSVPDKKLVMEAAWSVLILNEAQKDMHGMPVFTPVRILEKK